MTAPLAVVTRGFAEADAPCRLLLGQQFQFRFPSYGSVSHGGVEIEVRQGSSRGM